MGLTKPKIIEEAAGVEYEEIIVGNTEVSVVYHSLSNITHCHLTPTYYQETEKIWPNPGTYVLWYLRNKMGATKTYSGNSSLSLCTVTYGADGSITPNKPEGGSYTCTFRWSHIICVNDSEGVSLIG